MGTGRFFGRSAIVLALCSITAALLAGCGNDDGGGNGDDGSRFNPGGQFNPGDQFNPNINYTFFPDDRDGKSYRSVTIGSQTWMAENLSYAAGGSKCYGEGGEVHDYERDRWIKLSNSEVQTNCAKYGRLYDWDAAMIACPADWHLPSDAEWETLYNSAGGYGVAGKKLRSEIGWRWNDTFDRPGNGTDDYGFSALPGGESLIGGDFWEAGEYGYWWSATESAAEDAAEGGASSAWHRVMSYFFDNNLLSGETYKSALQSVRCVHD